MEDNREANFNNFPIYIDMENEEIGNKIFSDVTKDEFDMVKWDLTNNYLCFLIANEVIKLISENINIDSDNLKRIENFICSLFQILDLNEIDVMNVTSFERISQLLEKAKKNSIEQYENYCDGELDLNQVFDKDYDLFIVSFLKEVQRLFGEKYRFNVVIDNAHQMSNLMQGLIINYLKNNDELLCLGVICEVEEWRPFLLSKNVDSKVKVR